MTPTNEQPTSEGVPTRTVIVSDRRLNDRRLRDLRAEGVAVLANVADVADMEAAIEEVAPHVVIVDVDLDAGAGFKAIERVRYGAQAVGVLAATSTPPVHGTVARALAAGASGFVEFEAPASMVGEAVRTVAAGDRFLPVDVTVDLLSGTGADLGLTSAQRDARLRNLVISLIPLAGFLTALMSLLWRGYLGSIGVRPVDLAIDPATRLVDAFFWLSVLLAVFGPLLFVGTWLDLIRDSGDQRVVRWLRTHRRTARLGLTVAVVLVGALAAYLSRVGMALIVGPFVGGLLLAKAFDLDDDLPPALQLSRWEPARAGAAFGFVLVVGLSLLSYETLVLGPDLRPDGAHGWIAPDVLGFRAQPMLATTNDTGEQSEILYLGGNADLYVLVDPCSDRVVLVSVGSTQLEVIDEVQC